MKKILSILLFLACLSVFNGQAAKALKFEDKGFKDEKIKLTDVITDTEIHGDATFANFWNLGISGGTDTYNAVVDYRIEAHTPLYRVKNNKGMVVTRVEGFGTIGNTARDNFFSDPLIDIPELFVENDSKIKGHDAQLVFGKFANRRFFDKNEIAPDPFDIGERPFFGSIANTNSLLNRINQGRDPDQLNSIQATGSYGFMAALKDNDGKGLLNRWGVKQAFEVAQMDNFGDNFYGISEVNKNWGDKKPGQFNAGFLYGQDDVFRVPYTKGNSGASYLMYTSITQKINDRITPYVRYGHLNNTDPSGNDLGTNQIIGGVIGKLTNKDILASHLSWIGSNGSNPLTHLNFWIHKFNDHLNSTVYAVWRYGAPNPAALGGEDNNWTVGMGLTGTF